jgi:polar amino acid transport system substrate-binding protein
MRKTFLLIITFITILPVLSYCEGKIGPEKLIYMCEDIPPSNYMEDGKLKGVSIEILKLIWQNMECPEQPIKVVPWARGYKEALSVKNTVLFSMSRNKERESLFKWVGPIFTVKSVLLKLRKNDIRINNINDAKKYRIGTIKDDVLDDFLMKKGFDRSKVEAISGLKQNFDKLINGRIDFIAHSTDSCNEFIKNNKLNAGDFSVVLVLAENPNYFAFNKEVPNLTIGRFNAALGKIKKEHYEILKKYGLDMLKGEE